MGILNRLIRKKETYFSGKAQVVEVQVARVYRTDRGLTEIYFVTKGAVEQGHRLVPLKDVYAAAQAAGKNVDVDGSFLVTIERCLTDSKGRRQGKSQSYGLDAHYKGSLSANQEEVYFGRLFGEKEPIRIVKYLASEQTYKDNKLDGTQTIFNRRDGFVAETISWRNGLRNGPTIRYDGHGNVKSIEPYENGLMEGIEISYLPSGPSYVLYRRGIPVLGDTELRKLWKKHVEGLKAEKVADKEGRAVTFKELTGLESGSGARVSDVVKAMHARSKEERVAAIEKFHSTKSPAGIKRRPVPKAL